MDRKAYNKQQRQFAKSNHRNNIYISKFIHNLNNKLCALQATAQISIHRQQNQQQLVSHIETIIFDISSLISTLSSQLLSSNYKRTKLPRSFFTTN